MTKGLHEQLMDEFRTYFKNHQDWAMNQTHAAGKRTRVNLYNIRKLALALREEILEIRRQKPKIKSPKYREAQKKLKDQAQDNT